jgi:hypothetical protein
MIMGNERMVQPDSLHQPGGLITIVSGLPRSGTSMMMAMLDAGGMPLLIDEARPADDDNPRGYFEYAPVKQLRMDKAWVGEACGKAVKVISWLLEDLPHTYPYRVVFMRRALPEVLASQRAMLTRQGKPPGDNAQMTELFEKHLRHLSVWLTRQPHMLVLEVEHRLAIEQPHGTAQAVNEFLGGGLDTAAMAEVVDHALYRQGRR